jgi:hypothetical protein
MRREQCAEDGNIPGIAQIGAALFEQHASFQQNARCTEEPGDERECQESG